VLGGVGPLVKHLAGSTAAQQPGSSAHAAVSVLGAGRSPQAVGSGSED